MKSISLGLQQYIQVKGTCYFFVVKHGTKLRNTVAKEAYIKYFRLVK
jgi:hypothetical protein